MKPLPLPYTLENDSLFLSIRLTPKGGRDGVDGTITLSDGRSVLAMRVRAIPEDGAANAALLKLLASKLGLAASAITLVAGATSRVKRIKLPCSEVVMQKLALLCTKTM